MMAELAPSWGKFGHPSGQVRQAYYYTVKLLQLGLQRAKKMCRHYPNIWTIRVGSSEYKLTKNEHGNIVLNCPCLRHFFFTFDVNVKMAI